MMMSPAFAWSTWSDHPQNSIEIDPLTGLGNMFAFLQAVKQAISATASQPGRLLGAVLFDIDNLADVQAVIGEEATNYVIATIASTLYRALPNAAGDHPAPALYRFSGDEFAMLVWHGGCDQVIPCVARMQQAVANLVWETYLQPITISASLACFPSCASGLGDLLAYTHLFMHRTKERRRGGLTCPCGPEHQNAQLLSVELHNNATALVEALSYKVLEAAEQLQATTTLALTDPLTELPNLRAARQVLQQALDRAEQAKSPVGLMLVDGDRLKKYNQLYGYAAGNEMIQWLGQQLQAYCRDRAFVARWLSGDEFILILPGCDVAATRQLAEQARGHVHAASHQLQIPITISVGIASYPETAPTAQQLIDAVEAANKRAKDGGRNRTCC